jgi:hypothetical protein
MKNTIIINNLDNIISSENTLYQYKDILINVYRVKNDRVIFRKTSKDVDSIIKIIYDYIEE